MADLLVRPGILSGDLAVPPSKSMAHRAAICSALAGDIRLAGLSGEEMSKDIETTIEAMQSLLGGGTELFCSESGSTLRFLIPLAAGLGKTVTFTGTGRLPSRPLGEYAGILGDKGVRLEFPQTGTLPLRISGQLRAGDFFVPGDISSQYVTGLLMTLPLLGGNSRIHLTSELESAPYVEMTIQVMRHFGVRVECLADGYAVDGNQTYQRIPYKVEGDYSQAAFWMVANYLGSRIALTGLNESSVQGDKKIISILNDYRKIESISGDKPVYEIDASQIPDLVPVVAVAAANTRAFTRIIHAQRLRYKESDRLQTTACLIRGIGGKVMETPDGLEIDGGDELAGGIADSAGDHRIAMAAAIAALHTRDGVTIQNYRCIEKSYPSFFKEFERIGGCCHELDVGK